MALLSIPPNGKSNSNGVFQKTVRLWIGPDRTDHKAYRFSGKRRLNPISQATMKYGRSAHAYMPRSWEYDRGLVTLCPPTFINILCFTSHYIKLKAAFNRRRSADLASQQGSRYVAPDHNVARPGYPRPRRGVSAIISCSRTALGEGAG